MHDSQEEGSYFFFLIFKLKKVSFQKIAQPHKQINIQVKNEDDSQQNILLR